MNEWTERPQDAAKNSLPEGDIGGDVQRSDAWGRRFVRQRPDGTWDVATIAYYVASDLPDDGSPAAFIQEQEEIINCTDPDDPGGTELDSNYYYAEVPGSLTGPLTNDECKRLRDLVTVDRFATYYD